MGRIMKKNLTIIYAAISFMLLLAEPLTDSLLAFAAYYVFVAVNMLNAARLMKPYLKNYRYE